MTPRIKNCSFQNYGVYTSRSYRKNFKSKTRWVSVRLGQTEQRVSGVFSILFFSIFCINLELSGWGVPAACPWLAQLPGNSGSMVARSRHAVTVSIFREGSEASQADERIGDAFLGTDGTRANGMTHGEAQSRSTGAGLRDWDPTESISYPRLSQILFKGETEEALRPEPITSAAVCKAMCCTIKHYSLPRFCVFTESHICPTNICSLHPACATTSPHSRRWCGSIKIGGFYWKIHCPMFGRRMTQNCD